MKRDFFSLIALLFLSGGATMAKNNTEEFVAGILSRNFETVVFSKTDVLMRDDKALIGLRVPFAELLQALEALGPGAKAGMMDSSDATLVGAKNFQAPNALGSVHSTFCYVMVLKSGRTFDPGKFWHSSQANVAANANVWTWSVPRSEGQSLPSAFYMSYIKSSYVLISNDLNEVQGIAETLISLDETRTNGQGSRGLASALSHEAWGYRQYRHQKVVDRVAAGVEDVGPLADALVFFTDPARRICTIQLFGSPGDKLTPILMNARAILPTLKPRGDGLWQTEVQLGEDQSALERMLNVMGLFGFAIYL